MLVKPLAQGNVTLFYYLSLVGFFSLLVGTIVMLRRPPDRAALHFYAICLLFFLMYSTSYTGKLNFADWTLLWTDTLAILFLPVVFLHFCLSFPERRLGAARGWVIPGAYLPALALAGAAVASQVLFRTTPHREALWRITNAIDAWRPLYFAVLFAAAFGVLLHSYRRTRSLTARKQMKWLVWGTGFGVAAVLRLLRDPVRARAGAARHAGASGLDPARPHPALARLRGGEAPPDGRGADLPAHARLHPGPGRDRGAVASWPSNLFQSIVASDQEPHVTIIAIVSTILVALLFSPVKNRIQEGIDRLFFRERYNSRRMLLRLSQDLNADLDLGRMAERLLDGVQRRPGRERVRGLPARGRRRLRDLQVRGHRPRHGGRPPRVGPPRGGARGGRSVHAEARPEVYRDTGLPDLSHYFPCRVKGELIAILGVGRKDGFEPLNSEEVDLLQALAAQAATAFVNGRLYQSLREKADELQELTEYNENIVESMDSGILVLGLDGRVVRWNRALEAMYERRREQALGRTLDEIFPESFMEALRGSLVLGRNEEIANIYKLHLPCGEGRALMVNVSVAPFKIGTGERCGTIIIIDDVTVRMRLEEQLQHSEKMASIGLLAAGVAHEVNTPLTGISSYTQMLRQHVPPGDARAPLLEKIEKQTFRAAKIINNLLNFSRSSSAEFESLDVNKLLLDVLSLIEHQLDGARIKVRRELADDLPAVRGNENRLQQVFFNLILNARDAMPRGGWLTLATHADDDAVVVEVSRHRPRHQARRTSSASTTRSSPRRASDAAPGSACRSPTASCRSTGGRSSWRAPPARGRCSRWPCPRSPPPRPPAAETHQRIRRHRGTEDTETNGAERCIPTPLG